MKPTFESINIGNSSFLVRKFQEKRFAAPYHYHPEFELTLILQGSGNRYVGTNMNDYFSGDLVLLGSNMPHCWKTIDSDSEEMSESVVIQFLADFMGKDFFYRPETKNILRLLNKSIHGIQFTGDTSYCKKRMTELVSEKDALKKLLLLLEILQELASTNHFILLNSQSIYAGLPFAETERINAVFAYIVENFQDKVTLQEAASAANMTPHAFCKYFKKISRKTFIEAVIDYRIDFAVKELINTAKPIEQIGFESGFNDISNFYKTFKERQKTSPLNYRNSFIKKLEG